MSLTVKTRKVSSLFLLLLLAIPMLLALCMMQLGRIRNDGEKL